MQQVGTWIVAITLLMAAAGGFVAEFNILDFGGIGDGTTLNTEAFEKAVQAIALAKGGKLVVPSPGVFLTAPFNLTSHMMLFIQAGATLLGSDDPALWPIIPALPSYGQGRDLPGPRHTSLIHGEHLQNVIITGTGTIDGQGAKWWAAHNDRSEKYTRGSLIEIMHSQHVEISHLTLKDSPFWTVHPYDCDDVVSRSLVITAPSDSSNTDGFDPDSCTNVLIEDMFYAGGDDSIAIKSGWDCAGIDYAHPTVNVTIRGLVATSTHACVTIGSEMSGGVSNVLATNLSCSGEYNGHLIKTYPSRGGYVRDITWSDTTLGSATRNGISITTTYGDSNPFCSGKPPPPPPVIKNIHFINVQMPSGQTCRERAGLFVGTKDSVITGVLLHNVHLNVASGGFSFNCSYVEGKAIDVTPTPCSALVH